MEEETEDACFPRERTCRRDEQRSSTVVSPPRTHLDDFADVLRGHVLLGGLHIAKLAFV